MQTNTTNNAAPEEMQVYNLPRTASGWFCLVLGCFLLGVGCFYLFASEEMLRSLMPVSSALPGKLTTLDKIHLMAHLPSRAAPISGDDMQATRIIGAVEMVTGVLIVKFVLQRAYNKARIKAYLGSK